MNRWRGAAAVGLIAITAGCQSPAETKVAAEQGIQGIVEIVPDPDPPGDPDAFCLSPMRLSNRTAGFKSVEVAYEERYREEGPGCNLAGWTTPGSARLGPEGSAAGYSYLGCSHYRTPNMICSQIRSWRVTKVTVRD